MRASASQTWRKTLQTQKFITQISTILLQHQNWTQIIPTCDLISHLTPSFFLQILKKTQTNPQISLSFFNYTKTHLGFKPDLKTQSTLIKILLQSTVPVKPILDSLIQEYPSRVIVDSVVETCKGENLVCVGLSEVVECYVEKGLYMEGLEVYRNVLGFGFAPGIRCCNGLLGVLERVEELKLGLCLCGSLMRIGVEFDVATWGNVARMLNKAGRMEAVVRLLDSGFCSWAIYDLVIDYYSKCGKFEVAFARIDEMRGRKIEPGFIAYSSILDGACRFGDVEVIETVMGIMTEKKLFQGLGKSKYDRVIKRLCNSGRTHASEMLYKRARDEGVGLEAATLGCMLSAFSKGGRMKEAVWIYGIISETGICLDSSYFQAFAELLCQEIPSKEMNSILICMIKRGVHPHDEELANLITWHCKKGQLKEAEDLVNAVT